MKRFDTEESLIGCDICQGPSGVVAGITARGKIDYLGEKCWSVQNTREADLGSICFFDPAYQGDN
jgi:hypothetical protein